jgi:tungstate transport system substrate-binding protein
MLKRWLVPGFVVCCFLLAGCAPAAPAAPVGTPAGSVPGVSPATVAAPPNALAPSPVASPSPSPSPLTAAAPAPTTVPRSGSVRELILATTTSTQDSGLLDVLVPMFEQASGYRVKTISVGTGAALALGGRGEADVVLVHAPESETQWMAQGNGTERLLVMHNDFVIVGPDRDPARVRGVPVAIDALRKIADTKAPFISRGDNSGTQQLELQLWNAAQIEPKGQSWYVESGTGMGQTLTIADQRQGYTISDRATWLTRQPQLALPILVEGDPALFNVYHVMPVNPQKFPNLKLNPVGGKAFADFMVAPATQQVIGDFGKDRFGQPLFIPDAGKKDEELTR